MKKLLILGAMPCKVELIREKCKEIPVEIISREDYMSHDLLPICDFVIIRTQFVSHPGSARTAAKARGAQVVYHDTRGISTLSKLVASLAQESHESHPEQ